MKKESIFTKEGVFGCDVSNLRFWKLRRSTLLREVVVCGDGDTAFFSEEVWSSQRKGKTGRFFFVISKSRSAFSGREKHHYEFFFQMCRSCSPSSLIRHSQSSRWFFSVVLLEDVIVEDWGGFTNSFFFLGRTREPLLWPNFNHWSRENAGAEAAFFFFRLGCCSGAFYILGSAGFLIRMVSNK